MNKIHVLGGERHERSQRRYHVAERGRRELGLEYDYTRGRRDGYMEVLEELVKAFKEERGD